MELVFRNRSHMAVKCTATHLYLRPHPALRPYVAHYTLCLAMEAPPAQTSPLHLIPDASGCLVFTLEEEVLRGLLYGPTDTLVTVTNDLGRCPLRFFVEFRPGGLRAFTSIPQWELTGRIFSLEDAECSLHRLVCACWEQAQDLDQFVAAVDRQLLSFCTAPALLPPALRPEDCGYSPRHLSRLFRAAYGMGAKRFSHVMRANQAVRRMQAGTIRLTDLAQDLGYFDQAHFIRAFQSVCGVTPGQYRAGVSAFYNEPLKF